VSAKKTPPIGVIQFPGVNCEYETVRAARFGGLDAKILRWNEPAKSFRALEGFVLPGGFSYQDRIRAGAVAAKDAILDIVAEEASKGKVVLGICNGAQILVESGLVPGVEWEHIEMALAPNAVEGREGYLCQWTYLRVNRARECPFNVAFQDGDVLPVPVAHGEGRFCTENADLLERVSRNGQIVYQYCKADGSDAGGFPYNPNGSCLDVAGITSKDGNVMALMPHPERSSFLFQLAWNLEGRWGRLKREKRNDLSTALGPGIRVFESMSAFLQ
jgi:phosphoribosylformylglycinamidine synthase